ncbi:HNH/endonuclease VII fold putative polymorphic toxin [Roseovarius sp. EL26]|uniref:HNH/endonuclease VII fold putative polymorphic toxin n=1 Tax=Roseovarius sp. EL26 TaxID=2126672 RepID=UPI000EA1CD85
MGTARRQNQLGGQGQLIETRNYVYDHPKYGQIVVKEHSVGHPAYSGKPASQPHFNIERYHGETNGKHQTSSISDVSGYYTFDGSGL